MRCRPFVPAGITVLFLVVSTGAGSQDRSASAGFAVSVLTTCESASSFRSYIPRREFKPGESACLYAEAVPAAVSGRIDLVYNFRVFGPDGTQYFEQQLHFSEATTNRDWAGWVFFEIPRNARPGLHTVHVEVENKLSSQKASRLANFTVQGVQRAQAETDDEPLPVRPLQRRPQIVVVPAGREEALADSNTSPELLQAEALIKRRQPEEALKLLKEMSKRPEGKTAEVQLMLARAFRGMGAFKNAVKTCDAVLAMSPDNDLRAQTRNLKGIALVEGAGPKDTKELAQAETEFRAVLELEPDSHLTRYNLGVALLKQHRDEEGIRYLKEFLEADSDSANAPEVRKMIENPRRARENFAPEFSLVSLQGEYFDLEELKGKVIVLDFWATWCGPCKAAIPDLRSFQKKYSREPFALISVSDEDETTLRNFFATRDGQGMVWPQCLDKRRDVSELYRVRSIPTYVVIDAEGVIRGRLSGWGPMQAAELESLIRQSLKALKKTKTE